MINVSYKKVACHLKSIQKRDRKIIIPLPEPGSVRSADRVQVNELLSKKTLKTGDTNTNFSHAMQIIGIVNFILVKNMKQSNSG